MHLQHYSFEQKAFVLNNQATWIALRGLFCFSAWIYAKRSAFAIVFRIHSTQPAYMDDAYNSADSSNRVS